MTPRNGSFLGAACWSSTEYFIWVARKARKKTRAIDDTWHVYLLRCVDGSLYTGITKDVNRRCEQHNAGTASRYTRSRRPVELVYQETLLSKGLALKREAAIKAMSRGEKESLVQLVS